MPSPGGCWGTSWRWWRRCEGCYVAPEIPGSEGAAVAHQNSALPAAGPPTQAAKPQAAPNPLAAWVWWDGGWEKAGLPPGGPLVDDNATLAGALDDHLDQHGDQDAGSWETAVESPVPCRQCGGIMVWWDFAGRTHCMTCEPAVRSERLRERAARLRRQAR